MKYQSELIKEIVETRGHEKSSIHYESECVESWIEETKGAYPKLCDYQSEWLNYINENPIGNFPYEIITDVTGATINNVVPYAYKSAILKGSTKYRDIDTGDILDTFDETKNLELVSVKMPVLTTSNEDGTKTNILSTPSDLELRGIGDVKDELNLLTGEVVERIGEMVLNGSEEWSIPTKFSNGDCKGYSLSVDDLTSKIVCDGLKILPNSHRYGTEEGVFVSDNLLNVKKNIATRELFKQWLSENPITIQYQLATESIKTVDLTVIDQDGNTLSTIKPIEGTMHIHSDGTPLKPTITMEIPIEATTQNLCSFIEEE